MKNSFLNKSVSVGTMNSEDLLITLTNALVQLRLDNNFYPSSTLVRDARVLSERYKTASKLSLEELDSLNDDASEVVDELFTELHTFSPAGYFFGSHPGNGADYGFWKNEEEFADESEMPFTPEYPGRDASNPYEW